MSKSELIKKYLKNAKINTKQLSTILHCFAYDLTASNAAKELGLSRQTINSYYKIIREFLIKSHENVNLNNKFNKNSFLLKYINLKSQIIFYIQDDDSQYILDETNISDDILNYIMNQDIKNSLINHKKTNTARILYHTPQKEYFISTYQHSKNPLEEFIVQRLKKFRGINKKNNMLHIKESIIRYNTSEEFLFHSLSRFFI
jgi:hypothetical protein